MTKPSAMATRKLGRLEELIAQHESAIVAYSGGVDSTFLAAVAGRVLKGKVLLVTATSSTYPFFELEEAKKYATDMQIPHRVIVSEETDIPGFADNPPDRCYYCKGELFTLIKAMAQREGYAAVFDGSNADDTGDYRPGRRAIAELGIVSPLLEAGLTKEEIRELSRVENLPTADKPAFACLASRFPYGEQITPAKLDRVAQVEYALRQMGYGQFRVRSHGDLARLEFDPDTMDRAWAQRSELDRICRDAGFVFACLDLVGYRTGAMNEALSDSQRVQG